MASMMMVLFVTLAVTVTVAMTVKPCCFPEQYEGNLAVLTQKLGFRPSKVGTMANFSIDYKNEKIAVNEEIFARRRMMKISMYLDFKAKKQYIVFWEKKRCCAQNLTVAMQPRCALNNATYTGSVYFGVGASALSTTTWGITAFMPHLRIATEIAVTQKNCVPFSQIVTGRSRFSSFLQIVSYYNNTLGIKDPGVFTPPDFCKKDNAQDCTVTREMPAATQHIVDFVTTEMEKPASQTEPNDPLESNESFKTDGLSDMEL